ncbi:hypothetical protein EVAR_74343_1 [Eumeta japonica]|uniref:Uncharacterized protein n=1 Tax=Eumeta variegata TaxID=151549 RepID=A0A4C1SCT8_EUMVA|nr:hypothetical protein EVAR_74343_1 [Eumeta japonica]
MIDSIRINLDTLIQGFKIDITFSMEVIVTCKKPKDFEKMNIPVYVKELFENSLRSAVQPSFGTPALVAQEFTQCEKFP